MSRLLAVELAPGEVRLARAERRLGATRLVELARHPYADQATLAAVLAPALAWRPTTIVTALPLARASHRVLTLPFRDPRRLTETVPLELAGQLPVDVGDAATGFVPIETSSAGTRVVAALARRAEVDGLRKTLAAAGAPAARVELAPLAAWHVVEPARAQSAALVVADGGASALALRRDGRHAGMRALATDPSTDAKAFATEVRWVVGALGGAPQIVLAGPDASAALAETLAAGTGIPVESLEAAARPGWREPLVGPCVLVAGLAVGTALALDEAPASAGVRPRRVAALAAAVTALAVADVALVRARLERRDAGLVAAIHATAAAALPAGTPIVAPRTQLEAAAGEQARRPVAPAGVLTLLRELSARVPAEVRLDLDTLSVEDGVLRLHGRTDRYETIDALARALATSPALHDVAPEDARATVDGRGVEFGLRATWRPVVGAPS